MNWATRIAVDWNNADVSFVNEWQTLVRRLAHFPFLALVSSLSYSNQTTPVFVDVWASLVLQTIRYLFCK